MAKNSVIAAIDIGSAKICTLIAIVEEGGDLRVVGASAVKSQGVSKSQIVNLEEASAAITESVDAAERMAGFSVTEAFVSISGRHIESLNSSGVVAITDPQGDITASDIERVVDAARAVSLPGNREVLHVIPTAFKVDSQEGIKDPIGMSGVRLEATTHIITGSATVLKNVRKCVEHLGITVSEFVFSALAASYATVSETEQELGVALVDIGAGSTAVSVFVEGSLVYSTVIPVGALHITKDIALGTRVSIPAAETIKLALSRLPAESPDRLPNESREDARKRKKLEDQLDLQQIGVFEDVRHISRQTLIDGIISPRVREIFELVKADLEKQHLLSQIPAGLVLTGGGAETMGATESVRRVMGLSARVGKPSGVRGLIDEIETPMYATSMGLLLYGRLHGNAQPQRTGGGLSKFSPSSFDFSKIGQQLQKLLKSLMP
jgi:cell division protein FtsA